MQQEMSVQNDQVIANGKPAWRKALSIITILLLVFNVVMIIVVDIGTHLDIGGISNAIPYRGFWMSMVYELPPFIVTLFAVFMKKDSLGTLIMAVATSVFFILVYLM